MAIKEPHRGASAKEVRDATQRELERRDKKPLLSLGEPTTINRQDCNARLDDLVRVEAGASVRLPKADAQHAGRTVMVFNGSTGSTSTVRPAQGDLIKTAATSSVPALETRRYTVYGRGLWLISGGY